MSRIIRAFSVDAAVIEAIQSRDFGFFEIIDDVSKWSAVKAFEPLKLLRNIRMRASFFIDSSHWKREYLREIKHPSCICQRNSLPGILRLKACLNKLLSRKAWWWLRKSFFSLLYQHPFACISHSRTISDINLRITSLHKHQINFLIPPRHILCFRREPAYAVAIKRLQRWFVPALK